MIFNDNNGIETFSLRILAALNNFFPQHTLGPLTTLIIIKGMIIHPGYPYTQVEKDSVTIVRVSPEAP